MKKNNLFFHSLFAFSVLAYSLPAKVNGHGYVTTPRSRQWVAAEDGMVTGPTLPVFEDCPSCAKQKNADGFCGIVDNRDYDNPLDQSGNPMVPQPQAIYTEGQVIDMEFVYTINHNGHHVTYACPDFENPTTECFLNHPLEFIEDISVEAYGTNANAPKDPNYPERGYVNPGASHTKMRFKLPEGLTGDLVLLQWHWVTGNSCRSAGYENYPYPAGWAPSNMGPCPDRENLDPAGAGRPQQYWNCMDVKIIAKAAPSSSPSTSPTNAHTSMPSFSASLIPSFLPTTSQTPSLFPSLQNMYNESNGERTSSPTQTPSFRPTSSGSKDSSNNTTSIIMFLLDPFIVFFNRVLALFN